MSGCRPLAARSITWVSDRTADWETHVGYGTAARALFFVIPALLGAGLGVALHFLLGWLLGLPWLPFQGPLSLLDSIPDQVALPVLIGLGMVAGLIFGAVRLGRRAVDHRGRLPGTPHAAARPTR